MSNWDKDLIGLTEKSDKVPARGKPVKVSKVKRKTFIIFILPGLLLGSIVSFYYLSNQSWFTEYFFQSHNKSGQIPLSPVHNAALENIKPEKQTKTNTEKPDNKPESGLKLDFYDKLARLDNHNHLFTAFKPLNFDQVKYLFSNDQNKYSYFVQIGEAESLALARQLQADLFLAGWMTEIRIHEHQEVREYRLMLGPYYQLNEVTSIYKKLVKKQIDHTIYALQLD